MFEDIKLLAWLTVEVSLAVGFVIGCVAMNWRMKKLGWVRASIQCPHYAKLSGRKVICLRPKGHPGRHIATAGVLTSWDGDERHMEKDDG